MKKNVGIDALKIIAIFFVLILHMDSQGGILSAANTTLEKSIVYLLEIISICAVNVYAIITGYLKYNDKKFEKYEFKKIIYLWLEVFFYAGFTYLLFDLLTPLKITRTEMTKIFFPISTQYVWYFTAYAGLFFVMPLVKVFVRETKNNVLKYITTSSLIMVFIYSLLVNKFDDFFFLNNGYSLWWIIYLFYIGCVIKKLKLVEKIERKTSLKIIGICYLITFIWEIFIPKVMIEIFGHEKLKYLFNQYISITILLISIFFVILFSGFKFNEEKSKIISYLAPATFGVYVMHLNPLIWGSIKGKFSFILKYPIYLEPIIVIIIAFILLVIMLFIDKIREYLFKLLKVDKLSSIISNLFNKVINKMNYFLLKY